MKKIKIVLVLTTCLWALDVLGRSPAKAYTPRIQFVAGSGQVKIQRNNRSKFIPVSSGTEIKDGDQIFPDKGLTVKLKCNAQGDFVRVPSGKISTINQVCPKWSPVAVRGGAIDQATDGGLDITIPYLIAPRHTLLISKKPLILWNPVSGTTDYTVKVIGSSGTVWETITKDSQVLYGGKPLNPGELYTIIIRTNTEKSSLDDRSSENRQASNLDFRILRPLEANAISTRLPKDDIDLLELVEEYNSHILHQQLVKTYHLPLDTYDTYSLDGEAILLLRTRIEKGKASPLIYRTLANLYRQVGLIRLAESLYLQTIALCREEDLEDKTLAQESLGWLYAKDFKDSKQALNYYEQAKDGFSSLGDVSKVDEIQRKINKL